MRRVWRGLLLSVAVLTSATCDEPSEPSGQSGSAAPTAVTASPGPHMSQNTITWASSVGAETYRVYWRITPDVTPQNGTKLTDGTLVHGGGEHAFMLTHKGLTPNTTYYYVVTAATDDAHPEGPPSVVAPATASGDVGFWMYSPEAGQFVGDSLALRFAVESRYTLQSVVVTVAGRSVGVTGPFPGSIWLGTMSLAGLPLGPLTATIAATDMFSNVTTGLVTFIHGGAPPALTITAPESLTVARPNVRLTASCVGYDLRGCYELIGVLSDVNMEAIAHGSTSFDQTVSLAAYDGKAMTVVFQGTDSTWHVASATRRVFVELSSNLTEVASVHGVILDAQPDRILFQRQASGGGAVAIHDRVSGNDVVIYDQPGHVPQGGFLTPLGALFLENTGSGPTTLHEWQSGVLSDLGTASSLVVKGGYAVFVTSAGLIRRDLTAGANAVVDPNGSEADVAANGDVVYQKSDEIWRFRNGVSTQLTNDGATFGDHYPITDGVNVAYLKLSLPSGYPVPIANNVAVYDATGEHFLTPAVTGATPRYRVANGWVAYTKGSQVWSRSPAGQEVQASAFASGTGLDALGPNGEIALVSTRRYLAVPDYAAVPRNINSALGSAFFQNGGLFVTIGRSLFQVNP